MSFQLSLEQFHTMILYDWKIALTYHDCIARLVQAWRSNAPSDYTVFNWVGEFQRNKFTVQDAPLYARRSISITEQTIDTVRKIIEDNPHSTYERIEVILGTSSTPINSIIYDHLNIRKVCTR